MSTPAEPENARFYAHQRYQLSVAVFIVLASLVLTPAPSPDGKVSLLGWDVPSLCPHQLLFHATCPGCGLIRSFTALAHGQFAAAMAFHRVGALLFLAVLMQIPLRLSLLRRGPSALSPIIAFLLHWSGPFLISSIILSWIGKQFHWF